MRESEGPLFRPLMQKLPAVFALFFAAVVLAVLLYRAFFAPGTVLYATALSPNVSVRIIDYLDRAGETYRFDEEGRLVVSAKDAGRLRQQLSKAGIYDAAAATPLRQPTWGIRQRLLQAGLLVLLLSVLYMLGKTGRSVYRQIRSRPKSTKRSAPTGEPETVPKPQADAEDVFDMRGMTPEIFRNEHPQSAAVFLLAIAADRSAALLEAMPRACRERIWKRMLFFKGCDERMQERVVALFKAKAASQRHAVGAAGIREIFAHFSPALQREIYTVMEENGAPSFLRAELAVLIGEEKL